MGAIGSTTVNFGSFPGSTQASVSVTGQSGILTSSHVEAFIDASIAATADHSSDEHIASPIQVYCSSISTGSGFTITAISRDPNGFLYGQYNVSWVWI